MMKAFFNENNEFKYDLTFFICKHCIVFQIFDNSIEFRNHCLKYYMIDIRFSDFKHRQQNENYKRYVREHVYNYSSFFSHEYVIVQISIFDWNFIFCLNTDEEMSFCSKSLLFQNKNLYDIVYRIRSITITKIVEQQICDEYVEQEILLNFNKFFIIVKIYLINRLQSNLIIDMNVLNRDDIDFQLNRNMFVINEMNVFLCYSSKKISTSYHFVICNIMKFILKIRNRKWKFDTKKSMNFASKMIVIFESIDHETIDKSD